MRVVVAGGAGFIGSHLCQALIDRGQQVLCVDNLVTGRLKNIEPLLGHPRFTLLLHDLCEPLPPVEPPDAVFHLASPASPPGYDRHPIETLRVNSEGTRHLLELSAAAGARFLYASTSEIYGDPLEHPQREEYRGNVSSIGPRSMYDEAKRFGEALTMAFVRTRAVDGRIVRIFNTYGPHSDPEDGRFVPNFIVQALRGEPLTIYGDGSQTRSLCYVSDLVRGLLAASGCAEARGEVINLGNPEEHTVLEFAELIQELTGATPGFRFMPPAVGDDPQRRRPDITKAGRLLGWAPEVQLLDGLEHTIRYFRNEISTNSRPSVAAPVTIIDR